MKVKKNKTLKQMHHNKYASFSKAKMIPAFPLCRKPRYVQR